MPSPHAIPLNLTAADRATLEGWSRRRKTAQALATRARIVLACAEPRTTNGHVAARLGVSRPTEATWRRRFAERGPDGLLDERAVTTTLEAPPPDATHWSTRSLARAVGLSQSAVVRIWRVFASACGRTASRPSSSPPTRCSWTRSGTSSGST